MKFVFQRRDWRISSRTELGSGFVNMVILLGLFTVSCNREPPKDTTDNRIKSLMVLQKGGDAVGNKILLTEIREGRISNVIESLEFSVDCSIVVLGQQTNSSNQELILRQLRTLKEYRQKYPRSISAPVADGESNEIIRKAQEILNAIE